jgi:ribosomal protein S18 acetylase RimI-like enzyme
MEMNRMISLSDIRLCVEPDNEAAIELYKKHGFRATGKKWGTEFIYELKSGGK